MSQSSRRGEKLTLAILFGSVILAYGGLLFGAGLSNRKNRSCVTEKITIIGGCGRFSCAVRLENGRVAYTRGRYPPMPGERRTFCEEEDGAYVEGRSNSRRDNGCPEVPTEVSFGYKNCVPPSSIWSCQYKYCQTDEESQWERDHWEERNRKTRLPAKGRRK